jgi:hypothetical protein
LNQAMNFTGILLFAGLTVWDTNRLKELSSQLESKQGLGGLVVIGAPALYLDFINCSCYCYVPPGDKMRLLKWIIDPLHNYIRLDHRYGC